MPRKPDDVMNQNTRTKIAAHPELPISVKFSDCGELSPEDATTWFENGEIIVLDDYSAPDLDLRFLRNLGPWPMDAGRRIKKAKFRDVTATLTPENQGAHLLTSAMQLPPGDAVHLQEQCRKLLEDVKALVSRKFSNYTLTGEESHSIRLCETIAEDTHVDSFSGANDELTRLRLFYNYDTIPRIWNTTWPAVSLLSQYYPLVRTKCDAHPNEINDAINLAIPWHECPKHSIFFAPKALWICDSQKVSHEIFYGRRGFAFTFAVEPSSLRDPGKQFQAEMRAFVARAKRTEDSNADPKTDDAVL